MKQHAKLKPDAPPLALAPQSAGPRAPRVTVQAPAKPGGPVLILVEAREADASDARLMFGAAQDEFAHYATNMLARVLGLDRKLDGASGAATLADIAARRVIVNAALQSVAAFRPADELEGMIAVQAVALDCLARAMQGAASVEGRALYLSQANKSARSFAVLIDALNRNRGKVTTQKFVFEQVYVAPGAQAVVGAAMGGGGLAKAARSIPCASTASVHPRPMHEGGKVEGNKKIAPLERGLSALKSNDLF